MECDQTKAESKKSTKAEHEKCLSKDYIRALSLLYSPDVKSAEELRIMLEIEIAKQNKPKRTRSRANPRRSKRRKANANDVKNDCSTSVNKAKNSNEIDKKPNAYNDLVPNAVEEFENKDDIPRISIPDEDQNDGAVCKVCNVPDFGLLTLTQCNICEKYYHPLCHQPPIVDGCFQGPNSFWHCKECEEKGQS